MADLVETSLDRIERWDSRGPTPDYVFTASYRARVIHRLRSVKLKVEPAWAVLELLYYITVENEDLGDAVLVVRLTGGLGGMIDHTAHTPLPGHRIIRLLYSWDRMVALGGGLSQVRFRSDVLQKLAEPGEVLRARVRHARAYGR